MRLPILTIAVLACLSSCKPDSDAPCRNSHTTPFDFSSYQVVNWAYADGNSQVWLNQNGDTLLLKTGETSAYHMVNWKNNPDCPDDSLAFQLLTELLADSPATFQFELSNSLSDSIVGVKHLSNLFEFPYNLLTDTNAVTADSCSWFGRTYYEIYTRATISNDSAYYTNASGLIRLRSGSSFYTRIQ